MKSLKAHLFVAVPIPDSLKFQLHQWCIQLQAALPFKKWVFPADYHITLKFLGSVVNEAQAQIKPAIQQIIAFQAPFSLTLKGLDTFGTKSSPRILWSGVSGQLDTLSLLQKNIDRSMESLGFVAENRPYKPHLTLAKDYAGRTKFDPASLAQAVHHQPENLTWTVSEIVLYQTHLGKKPMYEAIETFPIL
jgi:2'-5' RNA ligase